MIRKVMRNKSDKESEGDQNDKSDKEKEGDEEQLYQFDMLDFYIFELVDRILVYFEVV